MKIDKKKISLYDLLICLTNAGDLISHEVADHHKQVAYLAFRLGEQMDLSQEDKKNLMLAGLLHDIGAFSLEERLSMIENEPPSPHDHAFRGARLLEEFPPLAGAAEIIRYHHVPWEDGKGKIFCGGDVSPLSHILHLADRIAVSIEPDQNVIDQIDGIRERALLKKGSIFMPEAVDAFLEISGNEYVWLDAVYEPLLYVLPTVVSFDVLELDIDGILDLTKIFASIIDFRDPFTQNHSAGVAETAKKLAELAGFSENECKMMFIAGNLHDLGKLAVDQRILHKPGSLNTEERNVMRSHSFYTYRLLQTIRGFETINKWASFHHEKLNGKGYPFHLHSESIPLGSRIMAVADIFTAVTEDRPYRKALSLEKASAILSAMVKDGSLCSYVVSLLLENIEMVDEARRDAQQKAKLKYHYVMKPVQ